MNNSTTVFRPHGIEGEGRPLFILAIVMFLTSTLSVAVRLVGKKLSKGGISKDDYVLIAALACNLVFTVTTDCAIYYGFGNSESILSESDQQTSLLLFWITQMLYKLVQCGIKSSLLVFYCLIFPGQRFCWISWIIQGVIVVYTIIAFFVTFGQCNPVSYTWIKNTPGGTCISLSRFWIANGIVTILTDVAILALPSYQVIKLHIIVRKKVGLCLIFGLSAFVIATSIARMTTLLSSAEASDETAGTLWSTIWTTVEVNVGLIIACLPLFNKLVVKLRKKLSKKSTSRLEYQLETFDRNGVVPQDRIEKKTEVEVRFEDRSLTDVSFSESYKNLFGGGALRAPPAAFHFDAREMV